MIYGNGIDIIEIQRIKRIIDKYPQFLEKYFTDRERNYFYNKKQYAESVAGYFAAKEAVAKALGTGFVFFTLKDIEIDKDILNKPYVVFYREAERFIQRNHINHITLSISHCKEYAVANVIATITRKG